MKDNTTDEIIKDLIPAIDDNGLGVMFDLIERKAYSNETTIPFIIGTPTGRFYYEATTLPNVDNIVYYDSISGYVDNLEAMKQAIYHILMTERYSYIIYSDNYGVEFEQYIGAEFEYIQSTIQSTLKDALMYDLRIKDVKVDEVTKVSNDIVNVKFTAYTIYGDLQLEVNINV